MCTAWQQQPTDGGSASETVFAAVSNAAPTINTISISPEEPEVGDTLRCDVSATDADGDELDITYTWSSGATGSTLVVPDGVAAGATIECTATATDSAGSSDTDSASTIIVNSAPTVTDVEIAVLTFGATTTATCSGSVEDPNGDDLDIDFMWENLSTDREVATSASIDATPYAGDTLRCTITGTDSADAVGEGSAEVLIDGGGPTELAITSLNLITDGLLTRGTETVTCEGTFVGDDRGERSLTLDLNGEDALCSLTSTDEGDSCTATLDVRKDDVLRCVYKLGGFLSEDVSDVVTNTAPVIDLDTVRITPSVVDATTTNLRVEATATDIDADEITYSTTWTWGETTVVADELSLRDYGIDRNNRLSFTFKATDSSGAEDRFGDNIAIVNSVPRADAVEVTGTPEVGSSVVCSYGWSDADATDRETASVVTWYTRATAGSEWAAVASSTTAFWTVSGSVGEEMTCSVQPSDGVAVGVEAFAPEVTITGDSEDDASEDAPEEFALLDVNTTSPTYGAVINPRDYLGQVSAYYFGHAT